MDFLNIEKLREFCSNVIETNMRPPSEACRVFRDIVQRDRNRRSLTPKINGLNNEAYRNALQAFIDRRRIPNDSDSITTPNSPDKERLEYFIKKNYDNDKNKRKDNRECDGIPGVPHVQASEIFEIGWVAGTEDRHIELIFAEWQTTRVSLRRHTHPDCRSAIKADLEVLTEIRHSNVLMLMATTHTDDHGLVAIFEPVDCTLFNYVHEQGERVSVQGIAKCAGSLACALKHAHMRGYVHGAISSHCVYLATSGTVKLGGWELASSVNSAKITREYEDRLRFEIYKWLAPEIFKGQEPTKATDVYGLTLLMWEMCTMNVPWSGLSKPEVEREFIQWGRGMITDLYNFPPLLNNLLDAGLQLDVSKRTLDMSRMRRFLQTLQIQYEDAEPFFIELSSNNNTQKPSPIYVSPRSNSPLAHKQNSAKTQKLSTEKKTEASDKENFLIHCINHSLNQNKADLKEKLAEIRKNKNVQKVTSKNVHKSRSNEKLVPKVRKPARKDDVSTLADPAIDSTDDETFGDSRRNIKKLKEVLASRRENFFYGSDSSQFSPPEKIENTKSRILTQVRSKDYEPHKPASHKTSLEPKITKSPGDFNNSVPSRSAKHQSKKSSYSHVPSAVRDAIVQPKILNPDSSSFFESSLWKKEKMICISKMRKSDNNFTYSISRFPSIGDQSVDKADSADSNCTYTVEDSKYSKNDAENFESTIIESTNADLTNSTISRSKSLQALKDALERATDIVKSTTPHPSESSTAASSPFKSPRKFDQNTNINAANESIFEDIYELKHDESDTEIKSIERSTNGEDSFFITSQKQQTEIVQDVTDKEDFVVRRRKQFRDNKHGAFEGTRLSSVACESIAESCNENDNSSSISKADDRTIILSRPGLSCEDQERKAVFDFQSRTDIERCHEDKEENQAQDSETSFALMVFSDKTARGCNSCNHNNAFARRRSLPAALGQLRNLSNVSLGKLPIRKVDLPDNTVEDLYIDDEFGDSLNVNMVLLDEDASLDDEDFLPDLLELSDLRDYQ